MVASARAERGKFTRAHLYLPAAPRIFTRRSQVPAAEAGPQAVCNCLHSVPHKQSRQLQLLRSGAMRHHDAEARIRVAHSVQEKETLRAQGVEVRKNVGGAWLTDPLRSNPANSRSAPKQTAPATVLNFEDDTPLVPAASQLGGECLHTHTACETSTACLAAAWLQRHCIHTPTRSS